MIWYFSRTYGALQHICCSIAAAFQHIESATWYLMYLTPISSISVIEIIFPLKAKLFVYKVLISPAAATIMLQICSSMLQPPHIINQHPHYLSFHSPIIFYFKNSCESVQRNNICTVCCNWYHLLQMCSSFAAMCSNMIYFLLWSHFINLGYKNSIASKR